MELYAFMTAILAGITLIASMTCGMFSSRASISLRKGKLTLVATVLFGLAFCFAGLSHGIDLNSRPVLSAEGTIDYLEVHPSGKGHGTSFLLNTSDGQDLYLTANGDSKFFRSGEYVKLTYHSDTRSVIEVRFLNLAGKEEGAFHSFAGLVPYGVGLQGVFIIFLGYKKFRQSPTGAK